MNSSYTWQVIGVVAIVTILLRFLPFMIFSNTHKTPQIIEKLSKTLPFAIMGMLVVYCLKDINITSFSHFMPEVIACLIVGIVHIVKRNTLMSIICGTVCYMILVQFVF